MTARRGGEPDRGWGESSALLLPRVALGGVMLLAGWMKLFHNSWKGNDPAWDFANTVKAYDILPSGGNAEAIVVFAAYAVPWAELLIGLALVLGVWSRAAGWLSAVMLAAFTVINISVIARGMDLTCSCFGDLEWPCAGGIGWCHVGRNAVLMLVTALIAWRGGGRVTLGWLLDRSPAEARPEWADEE